MAIETSPDSSQHTLTVLHRFSFSAPLPSWNCLKWSQSNRLIGLNLSDKLVIFQMNINYAITEATIYRKQWNEENLKFCNVSIEPENTFSFNVGTLINDRLNLRNEFMIQPKKPTTRFHYFDFSPSIAFKNYNFIGALTDDYCFLLYFQLGSQEWNLIHNLSLDLNQHFIQNNWSALHMEINFATYTQRLESLWTTCFCWDHRCSYDDKSGRAEFKMYSATKNGNICCWRISLLSGDESKPKCEATIEQIVPTDLIDIVTIKLFEDILLVESADGRIVLFDLRHNLFENKIDLWMGKDNLPCYNFCFSKVNDLIEIVFHKVDSIISVQISTHFTVESNHQYLLEEDIELLSIYKYDECGSYCATTFNSTKLLCFSISQGIDSKLTFNEVKFGDLSFAQNSSLFGFGSSTNRSLMAVVNGINSFCSKSGISKNVEIYFCTKANVSSVSQFLHNFLIDRCQTIRSNVNIFDYLYLFRHYLFNEQNSECIKKLLPLLLDKYNKINKISWNDNENEHLCHLKIVRFIIKRYWELSLFPELNMFDQKTYERAKHLLDAINRCITQLTMQVTIQTLSPNAQGVESFSASFLNCEQLVSLYNISRQLEVINNLSKGTLDQVEKLVKIKDKSTLKSHTSIRGPDYQLGKNKSLLDSTNKCPYCDRGIANVNWSSQCAHHLLDVCVNSMLIIDPLHHDMDLCSGCFESKLLSPRIWPSFTMSPFDYTYDCCLFCL